METERPSFSSMNRTWPQGSYRARSGRRRKRRQKRWGERIADWTRALIAFLFSNVGIVCLVVGYTIAGAFLFTYIEGNSIFEMRTDLVRLRNVTATNLWEFTSTVNVFSEKNWKSKVRAILRDYQNKMVTVINTEGYDGPDEMKQWSFAGAFLYSLTVITTIGYGNTYPRSKWGKIVTIIYAIIGMPLFLLYLSNIGDIFARSFKWTYARCCLCRCWKIPRRTSQAQTMRLQQDFDARRNHWQMINVHGGELETSSLGEDMGERTGGEGVDEDAGEKEEDDDDSDSEYDPQRVTVPLTLCLAIMVGYICGGAILFSEWEDWNFVDGSYFCFISLSTIGFGDIVPGDKIYSAEGLELSFIFCSMYLMLGMALIAMCFNLMQEGVIAKMRAIARAIKYIFRCNR